MAHFGGGFHGGGSHGSFHHHSHGLHHIGHSRSGDDNENTIYINFFYAKFIGPNTVWGFIFYPVLFMVIFVALLFGTIFGFSFAGTPKDMGRMQQFATEKYSTFYSADNNDTKENNMVMVFLSSQRADYDGYYCTSVIGDNINETLASSNTNLRSEYQSLVENTLQYKIKYTYSLGESFVTVINSLNEQMQSQENHFLNETKDENTYQGQLEVKASYLNFTENEYRDLKAALTSFKANNGIALSLVFEDMRNVMGWISAVPGYVWVIAGIVALFAFILFVGSLYTGTTRYHEYQEWLKTPSEEPMASETTDQTREETTVNMDQKDEDANEHDSSGNTNV